MSRPEISAEALHEVDRVFARQQATGAAPSAAWGVFDGSGVVHWGAAGALKSGATPGPATAYRIASCTKSFTAAAILILRDEGKLKLDDPVSSHVPGFSAVALPTADSPEVTLRMLLTMSAGFPTDDPWADRQESMTPAEFDTLLSAGLSFDSVPGTSFAYSNLGYALLGRVIESASGMGYREFVRERLLEPLGLYGTAFEAGHYHGEGAAQGARNLDGEWDYLPFSGPGAFSPIGGLFSTVTDLSRWAAWLASAFDADARAESPEPAGVEHAAAEHVVAEHAGTKHAEVLSRASRREMQQAQRIVLERSEHPMGYGLGLFVEHYENQGPVVSHSGGYPGCSAHMRWSTELGVGVVAFENATFSRVPLAAVEAFDGLLTSLRSSRQGDLLARAWPETRLAQAEVTALLRNWSDETARTLFTPNVELDMPFPQRREALAAALRAIGGLTEGAPRDEKSSAPSQLSWTVPGRLGGLRAHIQLTPELPPRVQSLRVETVAPAAGPMLR
ncbi:beta-lactamase family protein [Salinibacterium sp. SYSU T00001]|uniref:serine hydrolase domain-containing protein n=1 Tax=Homoserinimonas sedimenticola TaxID=2986805 RepID=UPI00223659AD|nr:serine hydrolase domain-containing protein [Salinibacterium sedimenticola]MCW4385459.1 beta-lactamase family protein [Salinibacterium sedimenticola]